MRFLALYSCLQVHRVPNISWHCSNFVQQLCAGLGFDQNAGAFMPCGEVYMVVNHMQKVAPHSPGRWVCAQVSTSARGAPWLPRREVQTLQMQARSEQRVAHSQMYQNLQQDRNHWRAQAEQMKGSLQQEIAKNQGAFRLEQEVQRAVRQSGAAWHTGRLLAS